MNIEKGAPQGTPFAPPPAVDESSFIHWQMIHHGSDYPVFDRIEKRKVLQTSVDVGLEHFLFIS